MGCDTFPLLLLDRAGDSGYDVAGEFRTGGGGGGGGGGCIIPLPPLPSCVNRSMVALYAFRRCAAAPLPLLLGVDGVVTIPPL